MGQKAETAVAVRNFRGMASNIDPHDVESGHAVEQVNVYSISLGELIVRAGLREITYDSEA